MKKNIVIGLMALTLLASCNKEKTVIKSIQEYNATMQDKGYHFGDKIALPSDVTGNAESISISFGDKESNTLTIDPKFFTLGENDVTFNIKMKDGKVVNQDATINVFASKPEQNLTYEQVAEYPHDPKNFVQGFQLDGNTVYESDGQFDQSRLIKYTLGQTQPIAEAKPNPAPGTQLVEKIFSEGSTIAGDKVFQLDWKNKIGFIYNKANLQQIGQFQYPTEMTEGWGLTYDGNNLIASDGSSNIYFLDVNDPSKVVRKIGVAGSEMAYGQINELEYYKGFIYANVWQQPVVLKIDPATGEVVGRYDFSNYVKLHTKGSDDVLNGIAFKGDNMLVTGKNWPKIYEVKLK
ncbi:glutaminyl-peptide cyclotransferase [Elizabethkingia anophelis]|uniref:Glutamine cyclotransferase n=1 Tax=Elizabethkingia anophelis NUHP1 TaxID=1338011 RepID=A0A077EG56_9FLAO|nr:glutaminyl-peptide cyclotransferase [Elizabethkingia anophelis]AIL46442.1 glutamine cyclotransferase [Elizabethkingia anophelis NUHP1]MBE9394464.1 glutaminyl-peptide cyclotransferase [Elizabethkingia anophelis]MBE9407315.1 glutaminyl-peptide cyclotransferase [Elizabethkingia anophelis]MCT4013476.1 glutaminyl-peptide cyclotransferase [Elizabethkingia anophelis]MDV3899217.1 glutamine cyclotransferase [Elizabethkingia anophelis]